MRKIFMLIIMLLVCWNTAWAFPNEPDGFRQYKWGMSISDIRNVLQNDTIYKLNAYNWSQGHETATEIKLAKSYISGALIKDRYDGVGVVDFCFLDNKLGQVTLTLYDYSNKSAYDLKEELKSRIVKLYGEPNSVTKEDSIYKHRYEWVGENTYIYLWVSRPLFDGDNYEVVVNIGSKKFEINREAIKEQLKTDKTYQGW